MPADCHRAVYTLPRLSKRNYAILMKTIHTSLTFDTSDIAKYRFHVLTVFYKHGLKAVQDAFEVKKSTLYDWKKAYEGSGKRLASLVPKSTKPKRTRGMVTDYRLEVFIKALRVEYGRFSKYKIKIFLDEYAKSLGIASYGVTKINKIIKRRHYYFYGKTKVKRRTGGAIKRLRRTPKETLPGYLQMDSITLYLTSQKYYFVSVIDIVTKFAWCSLVASSTAKNSMIALEKFQANYPYPVRVIQTDNGHEFLGDFQAYCEEQALAHEFIYPRSPKINGVVERFNRTVQEEFITRSDELYYNRSGFEEKLTKYLTWYNNSRPHHSLNLRTPVAYLKEF